MAAAAAARSSQGTAVYIMLVTAGATGLAAVSYFGLKRSRSTTKQDVEIVEQGAWSLDVRRRIRRAALRMFGGCALSAASGAVVHRLAPRASLRFLGTTKGMIASLIVTGVPLLVAVIMAPTAENRTAKNIAHGAFHVALGAIASPLALFDTSTLLVAGTVTGAVMGSLATTAIVAPDDTYMKLAFPLNCGLTALSLVGLGMWFWPSAALDQLQLWGGLLVFGGFVFHDTQALIDAAKRADFGEPFDEVQHSVQLFLDAFGIFVRVLRLLTDQRSNDDDDNNNNNGYRV